MPVSIRLIEDGWIIHQICADPWDMHEFAETFPAAKGMLDAADHPVHFIVNLEGTIREPRGVLRFRQHPGFTHPRTGFVVFVEANQLTRSIVQMGLRLIRFNRAKFFPTEAEALTFCRHMIAPHGETILKMG
ncbi:MAG TPA: hypothetical protein PLD47_06950 [Aggregatilineales bacterium]|nr:hypothetical protein [Anaerolineales bacterium]HRE47446.1 hypothetical protein [Aggregatilineales bacterium]